MNFKTSLSLILFIGLLSSVACTKTGYYEYPEEPSKIVISANAVAGERMVVFINYSLPYYVKDSVIENFKPVVYFKDTDNEPILLQPSGKYPTLSFTTDGLIRKNTTLELSISSPGFAPVMAKTMVPLPAEAAPMPLDRTLLATTPLDSVKSLFRVPFKIELADLASTDSLFAFRLNYERTILENGQELIFESKARFVAAGSTLAYLYELPDGTFLIDKKYWTNHSNGQLALDAMLEYEPGNVEGLDLLIEWRTVSPDYYKYHLSLARSGNFTIPLGTLDAIYNNVEGGYGNFSGFTRTLSTIKIL